MTWALILLFCVSASDCRAVPLPFAGEGYQSHIDCLTRGVEEAQKRGARWTFKCRSRVGQEQAV